MSKFVALADLLAPVRPPETVAGAAACAGEEATGPAGLGDDAADDADVAARALALGEVRRFRAALAEALEIALATVLHDIAAEVLARELELAPVAVRAVAQRALARFEAEGVVRVCAHASECEALAGLDVCIEPDAALRRGDVRVELRSGSIDLSLGARLADVVKAPSA